MRGRQGIVTSAGEARHGMWNDDGRAEGYLLYPICETTIPPAIPGGQRNWGTGSVHTVDIRVCIDANDYLFFQDDRLWLQYGGFWGAAGNGNAAIGGVCPADYIGTAYINDEPWDISSLASCASGSTCPVSTTFTDEHFMVPAGCQSVDVAVTKNSVRGTLTTQPPTASNGWRGEIAMADPFTGAVVFDFTVTLSCVGTAPVTPVRLNCVHNNGEGDAPCKMGRIEVWNPHVRRDGAPQGGAWGTMCGQWAWNNHAAANLVCQQLGFAAGEIYTFGPTNFLPMLPVVYGYRTCDGSERSLFNCATASTTGPESWRVPADMDCEHGCVGADGVMGTDDDTIQPGECEHSVDQGAICYTASDSVSQVNAALKCGVGGDQCHIEGNCDQGIVFGCIDYYTAQCTFDITAMPLGEGTYMFAMQAFAHCAAASPEPRGYCHGSLLSAGQLANHDVCENGATENIGFHIRIPFTVTTPGDYTFRIHADYGSGSFMGVDGAEYTPGDLWGHANIDATSLTAGQHEFDVLGFEPCCDGHAELEVHLPCDGLGSPWRTVVKGQSDCLVCSDDGPAGAACSVDTESAGCCGVSGVHILCHARLEDGTCDAQEDGTTIFGRFIAIGQSMNQPEAAAYCDEHYAGLASIHSPAEMLSAQYACYTFADPESADATPGCWIGLSDAAQQGGFVWSDGSAADFIEWGPSEPNGYSGASGMEDEVMLIDYFYDVTGTEEGSAVCTSNPEFVAAGYCRYGPAGLFPLCQTAAPAPAAAGAPLVWGTGLTTSFNVKV